VAEVNAKTADDEENRDAGPAQGKRKEDQVIERDVEIAEPAVPRKAEGKDVRWRDRERPRGSLFRGDNPKTEYVRWKVSWSGLGAAGRGCAFHSIDFDYGWARSFLISGEKVTARISD
jgi:hypothetical protein